MILSLALLGIGLLTLAAASALTDTYNPPAGAVFLAVLRPFCIGIIVLAVTAELRHRPETGDQLILVGEQETFEDLQAGRVLWKVGADAISSGFDLIPMSFSSAPFKGGNSGSPSLFHGKPVSPYSSAQTAVLRAVWDRGAVDSDDTGIYYFSPEQPLHFHGNKENSQGIKWIPVSRTARENTLSLKLPTHWFTETDLKVQASYNTHSNHGALEFETDGQILETRPIEESDTQDLGQASFTFRSPETGNHTLRIRVRSPEGEVLDETGASISLIEKPEILYVTMPGGTPRLLETLANHHFEVRHLFVTSLLDDRENPVRTMARGDLLILDAPSPGYLGPQLLKQLDEAMTNRSVSLLYLPYGGSEKTGLSLLQNLLPVYPGPPPRSDEEKSLALVTVVDTSFSMFDPQVKGGVRKIEMAKKALLNLSTAMRKEDRLGIMGTDLRPYWITDITAPRNPRQEAGRISKMTALGPGINFYSSLLAASDKLQQVKADIRHILVLLDTADVDEYSVLGTGTVWDLLQSFHRQGITVSLVGFGGSGDEHVPALNEFAEKSGGFLYLASDIEEIPGFFIQDLEQVKDRSIDIRSMKTFFPASDFPTIEETPSVDGQVIMTLKPGAKKLLWTERDLPLLAFWKMGNGVSAVLGVDSDRILAGSWSAESSATLWDLLISKLLPGTSNAPRVYYHRKGNGFEIKFRSVLLPHGSTVTGTWHQRGIHPVAVHFTETAPGEHVAFLPMDIYQNGHLEITGKGTDGVQEQAALTLPGIKGTGPRPSAPEVVFKKQANEPDSLNNLREPALLRLLLILAVFLITVDELFRAPTPE